MIKLRKYVIQQYLAEFTWVDVYDCFEYDLAKKFYLVLSNKYKDRTYRIVKEEKNV